ncbi:hypothetical protein AZE42_08607 [Rhizopogon vesiculosus]|uniref:Uncharacterized protein n=1 Tax=Rhizopogon vesiculosus TaxID=180088 RepID=A0A1J8PG32_9AGAM|nr:hypothetical protein AZE42_08607 [Rhizopogon vesiculosus]
MRPWPSPAFDVSSVFLGDMLSYQSDGSSYFPDGKQMIGRSLDKAIRRCDLQAGEEIEKARKDCIEA